jgi:cell wall-associated NlpC family hydrolase
VDTADQRPRRHQGAHREDRTASLEPVVAAIKEGTPMHHTRLAGGLISLAALLALLLVPSVLLAETSAVTAPSPGATPEPTPAGSPTTATASPTPTPSVTASPTGTRPRLTKAQRRAKLRAQRIARRRRLVLRVTRLQLGVPYVYGGASRSGFDCSGLTMYVYERLGWDLPHGATDQASRGRRVSLRRLEVGDLVFYGGSGSYSHVAIYAGNGRVIDAPHSGAVVSYSRVGDAATARRLIGS